MDAHIDIFELKTPADLFRKLESDLAALEASGQDAWIAFNFFVTAQHLPDWLGKRPLVSQHAILRIVSHIANGLKHFNTNRHCAITGTEKFRYVEEGYIEPGYFHEPLLIHLSPDEARELGAPTIEAVHLGKSVIEFWRKHL